MPSGFRYALARNTQAVIASMHGSEKAGDLVDYLIPPMDAKKRGEQKMNEFAQALEKLAGL